jgi:hypothetical protein
VFGSIGFFGVGISLHYQWPWYSVFLFECTILFGISFVNISTHAYVTDCLRDHAPEAYTSLNIADLYEFGSFSVISVNFRNELSFHKMAFERRSTRGVFNLRGDTYCRYDVDDTHVCVW